MNSPLYSGQAFDWCPWSSCQAAVDLAPVTAADFFASEVMIVQLLIMQPPVSMLGGKD